MEYGSRLKNVHSKGSEEKTVEREMFNIFKFKEKLNLGRLCFSLSLKYQISLPCLRLSRSISEKKTPKTFK